MTSTTSAAANFHAGGSGGVLLNATDSATTERISLEDSHFSESDAVSITDTDTETDSESEGHRLNHLQHGHPHIHSGHNHHGRSGSDGGERDDDYEDLEEEEDDDVDDGDDGEDDGETVAQRQSLMRKQIVDIQRDSSISPQEKAKRIQTLMTQQWSARQRRHSSRSAIPSNRLEDKAKDFGAVSNADQVVSYHDKEHSIIGCRHYQRSCKLQAHCCGKWFPCRFCHDEVSDHNIVRNLIVTMMCMYCLTVQPAGQECVNEQCGKKVAKYYCKECKLWDNDPRKNIYHCYDCGICRIGKGLGQDYFHCKKCNVCMAISLRGKHKCIERNLESDCPICGEYMFTSTTTVIFMPCGHCIHYKCHQEYIQTSYQCPTCFKSLANMSEYFRRIDAMLSQHQMPAEYSNSFTYVYCNDCEKKCYAKYHFLYHKCIFCSGYNTRIKILQTLEVKDGTTLDKLNELVLAASKAANNIPGPTGMRDSNGEPSESTSESNDITGQLLRTDSLRSIRHISSATPGFSTSNTSVLSAGSQLAVPEQIDETVFSTINAVMMGRRSSNAENDGGASRSRAHSHGTVSSFEVDVASTHSSTVD